MLSKETREAIRRIQARKAAAQPKDWVATVISIMRGKDEKRP